MLQKDTQQSERHCRSEMRSALDNSETRQLRRDWEIVVRWGLSIRVPSRAIRRCLAGKFEAQVGYFHSDKQYLQYII
jgi:hypothetical protein